MQHHITIRVRFQTAIMGYRHATQHQGAAILEGMYIKALPDSHDEFLDCR
jgi:hypothetical protein